MREEITAEVAAAAVFKRTSGNCFREFLFFYSYFYSYNSSHLMKSLLAERERG